MISQRFSKCSRWLAWTLILLGSASCVRGDGGGSEGSGSENSETEGVSISGSVPEDSAIDFVEAGESVQIGGTNLTADGYSLTVEAIVPDGAGGVRRETVHDGHVDVREVSLNGLPYDRYLIVRFDGRSATMVPPVPQAAGDATKTTVVVPFSRGTAVAAKVFDLIVADALNGNVEAATILANATLSVPSLLTSAASVTLSVGGENPVDLATVARIHVTETTQNVAHLSTLTMKQYADMLASSALSGIYGSQVTDKELMILAQAVVAQVAQDVTQAEQVQSGVSPFKDPTFVVVERFQTSNPGLAAAYIAAVETARIYEEQLVSGEVPTSVVASYAEMQSQAAAQLPTSPDLLQSYMDSASMDPGPIGESSISNGSSGVEPTPDPSLEPSSDPSVAPSPSPTVESSDSGSGSEPIDPTPSSSPGP